MCRERDSRPPRGVRGLCLAYPVRGEIAHWALGSAAGGTTAAPGLGVPMKGDGRLPCPGHVHFLMVRLCDVLFREPIAPLPHGWGGGRCWRMRSAATVVMHGQAPAHLAGVLAWRRLVSARFRRFTASCVLREKHPAALSGALGMQPRRARSTLPPSIRRNRRTKGRKAWDDPSRTVQMLRCGSGCCNDR